MEGIRCKKVEVACKSASQEVLIQKGFPDPIKPLINQDQAAFKTFLIEHNATLDIHSPRLPHALLSIMCTIGESCLEADVLEKMVGYGMRAARFDMSTSDGKEQIIMMRKVKNALTDIAAKHKRVIPLAFVGDIKGRQVFTGKLHKTDKIFLEKGNTITLTTHPGWDTKGTAQKLFVDYKNLPYLLKPRDRVFLDCGRIELNVRGTVDSDIICEILTGGDLGHYRDVLVLNVPFELPDITPKDKQDIALLVEERVDALFASAINKNGIREIRNALGERGKGILLFIKIENMAAFENFDEVLDEADGILINRGKLGIEMSTERVMQCQRNMIAKAMKVFEYMKAGKPIFVQTEYLNSMIHKDCPTIAESTDVVTAVLDGVDGIVMVDETSRGEDPVLVVRTLQTLAREAESQIWQWQLYQSLDALTCPPLDPAHAICMAAVLASMKCQAAAILVATMSGRSAQVLAKYKPRCPILGITRYGSVARQLNLWRGIYPVHYIAAPVACYPRDVDLRLQYAIEVGKLRGMINSGDALVLVNGWRQGSGFTNNIRIVYASALDPWVLPHSPDPPTIHHQLIFDDD